MPIYEYECRECGRTSELLLRSAEAEKNLRCSFCGSDSIIRLISVPGIIKNETHSPGNTCCGREERCDTPPCSGGGGCCR
jgi:putative FmdB family regulatory protein